MVHHFAVRYRIGDPTIQLIPVSKARPGAPGDIEFSRDLIKSTGDALNSDERATAWNPKGAPLQIEINAGTKFKAPVYWKWQMPW